MTLQAFIRDNPAELDAAIGRVLGHVPRTASCDCPRSGTDQSLCAALYITAAPSPAAAS